MFINLIHGMCYTLCYYILRNKEAKHSEKIIDVNKDVGLSTRK